MNEEEKISSFIPINRGIFEHKLWNDKREFSRFEAWLYLIKEARFEDSIVLDKNTHVTVKRGQVYASIRFLAKAWRWGEKKTRLFLDFLKSDFMIKIDTAKGTTQNIITICNYELYNKNPNKKGTVKDTTRAQQGHNKGTKSNTVNNDNTVNNIIKIKEENFFVKNEYIEIMTEMTHDQLWLEQNICMNFRISLDEAHESIKRFFVKKTTEGQDDNPTLKDCKYHFANWLKIEQTRREKDYPVISQNKYNSERICEWEIPRLDEKRKQKYSVYLNEKRRYESSNIEVKFLGFVD